LPTASNFRDGQVSSHVVEHNLQFGVRCVERLLGRASVDLFRVRIVAGLCQHTFHKVHIRQNARLDLGVDLYESIRPCLDNFYDSAGTNGFVSINEYGARPGYRISAGELFQAFGLSYLQIVDDTAHWFQKS
jgi:hypothetical protein